MHLARIVDTYEYAFRVVLLLFITFWKNVLLHFPPIYHFLEKCTATFSSYLSLKRNPVFGASAQRISRPSYTAVVALTATCNVGRVPGRIPAILPLKSRRMVYQPMSFFCNLENFVPLRSFVKRSPNCSSELIFTR
jgi:hypothetical protein